jgi:hypothetical protein
MNMQRIIKQAMIALIGCGAVIAIPAPALASHQGSGYQSIDRMSEAGRRGTTGIGRAVGNRMCGYRCGRAMGQATDRVYRGSRDFATHRGEQLRGWGRDNIAPRIRRYR